jgi:hypothetical protein
MMNEVLLSDEYIMEEDDTDSDHGKRKIVGRSAKLFCRSAALFNIYKTAPRQASCYRIYDSSLFIYIPFSSKSTFILYTIDIS